jgi:hypothetical protein
MPKNIAKTVKKTPKNTKGQITRPEVVSFRITAAQAKTLAEIHKREPATNVKSTNQRCRKVVVDYLMGRLDYKDANDKLQDLDLTTR